MQDAKETAFLCCVPPVLRVQESTSDARLQAIPGDPLPTRTIFFPSAESGEVIVGQWKPLAPEDLSHLAVVSFVEELHTG